MDMVRHLRVFVAVAEEGHFGDAARRLDLSQPAVSQILRRTERELGVDLIKRTQRGAELTGAGRALLARARLFVDDADRLISDARRSAGSSEALRWGAADVCGRIVAAECAARLAEHVDEQMPVVGSTVELIEQVGSGQLDLAVVEHPALTAGLESTATIRLPRRVIVPTTHPTASAERPRLSRLADLSLAYTPRSAGPPAFDQLIDELRAAGVDPSTTVTASVTECAALVAAGDAFTVTADPGAFREVPGVSVLSTDLPRMRVRIVYRTVAHRDLAEQLASDLWRLAKATP
ncbi:LysR family transcriptional regulator [Gordonia humi]|uniref:DNA-binding transcriptional LysR family regulator n=1 Tax=Gordonia humi TaxID=686429 RepID=A0A840EQT6_9ACTN|nr:LysR family transcriptional regulator [Gordonia humi]MBB4133881.1 DNA-binding transcriptional LysR family regulator [Gordonia humi]